MNKSLEIKRGVLDKNDQLAAGLRDRFQEADLCVTNWVSSPGSGKTALLEVTMAGLIQDGFAVAALVGDLATENDALRLARSGGAVRQIVTAGICHLDANMIDAHLDEWDLNRFDFLFIENVGNLVCPSGFDLGEQARVVLLSVTEGEDKPLKYPPLFHSADLAVITKIDLAEAVEFDREAAYRNILEVGPHLKIIETSAKRAVGLGTWIETLIDLKQATGRGHV